MKGAYLVAYRPTLFQDACAVLGARGAHVSADMAQVKDENGRLFTMFASTEPDWEFREEPVGAVGSIPWPDMSRVTGCSIECRWEDLFAEEVSAIATAIDEFVWVIDGNGILWSAEDVDPAGVQL